MTPVLEADSVGKSFRGRRVLSAASLAADAGSLTFLAGRNGSGKTTLLRICAGLLAPDHGTIRFAGRSHLRVRLPYLARRGLFYLPSGSALASTFSVRRQMQAFARHRGGGEVEEIAARLGISELLDLAPAALSGGERRRAGLALAMARRPRCLLLDEPLRGVAPRDAERILHALRELAAGGCAIVVTGHDVPVLLPASDRVVWITAGTTYAFPTPRAAEHDARFRREFLGEEEMVDAPRAAEAAGPRHLPPRPAPAPPAPGRLRVDAQTLRDLEIFEARPGGRSLFDALNRTRSSGGRKWLHRHFQNPPADLAEILTLQEAVRFLVERPAALAPLPDTGLLQAVERYRDSTYATTQRAHTAALAAQGAWYRVRHEDLFGELERGVVAALELLRSLRALALSLRKLGPPALLAGAADRILAATDGEALRPLRLHEDTQALSPGEVLAVDRRIREQARPEVERALTALHQLDALRSMAVVTRGHGFVLPTLRAAERPALAIRGVRHPFLPDAVPNDLRFAPGARLLFLTGPNMAGKTTYMKACALCVYLAHLGMGVPAEAMELTPLDALFTSINTADDLRRGYSFFFSEVRRVKEAVGLLRAGERAFIVFDEMFKGTNVRDAYEATRAVVAGLARSPAGLFLVSSHLTELVEDLRATGSVQFQCFDATIREGEPAFDYRLREGSSAQRLGMLLLEREGVLELLAGPGDEPRGGGAGRGSRGP